MTKRMLSMVCAGLIIVLMAACTGDEQQSSNTADTSPSENAASTAPEIQTELSEDDIVLMAKDLLEQGATVFSWYYTDNPELDIDMESSLLEGIYSEIGAFASAREMMEATEAVYTNRFCEKYLFPYPYGFGEDTEGNAHYKEMDGKLYINQIMDSVDETHKLSDQITVKSQLADEIVVTAVADQRWDEGPSVQIPYDFTLVKENGDWKLDSWYQYNAPHTFAGYRKMYVETPFYAGLLGQSWQSADELSPDLLVTYAVYGIHAEGDVQGDTVDADRLESHITHHFSVEPSYIRESQYYNADTNTYTLFGVGGVSNCMVTNVEINDGYLLLYYNSYQDTMLTGNGILRITLEENDGYRYHSNEYYAQEQVPREPIDSVIQSVYYDPPTEQLSITIPKSIPDGYQLALKISGWLSLGENGREPFHAFEQESQNAAWEAGKTYTCTLPQQEWMEAVLSVGLIKDDSTNILHEIEMYFYPDGSREFLSEMQMTTELELTIPITESMVATPEPDTSTMGWAAENAVKDFSIMFKNDQGNVYTFTSKDLYYIFYHNALKSAVLSHSWDHPSDINPHYLLNFFTAQSNWNQVAYDDVVVYLPQHIVEDYLKMYFDVEPTHIRQAELYVQPQQESYLLPLYPWDRPSLITNAELYGSMLTIYYETYDSFSDNLPLMQQGHVTIDIAEYPTQWKFISNVITYDAG